MLRRGRGAGRRAGGARLRRARLRPRRGVGARSRGVRPSQVVPSRALLRLHPSLDRLDERRRAFIRRTPVGARQPRRARRRRHRQDHPSKGADAEAQRVTRLAEPFVVTTPQLRQGCARPVDAGRAAASAVAARIGARTGLSARTCGEVGDLAQCLDRRSVERRRRWRRRRQRDQRAKRAQVLDRDACAHRPLGVPIAVLARLERRAAVAGIARGKRRVRTATACRRAHRCFDRRGPCTVRPLQSDDGVGGLGCDQIVCAESERVTRGQKTRGEVGAAHVLLRGRRRSGDRARDPAGLGGGARLTAASTRALSR